MQMRALDRVGALLCPTKCILCRRVLFPEAELICPDCRPLTENDMLRAGVSFSGCVSPMLYEGKVADAIRRLKFQDMSFYAGPLGRAVGRCIRDNLGGTYDLISWVPVSKKRLWQRGYDQAMLLARSAAEFLGTEAVSTLIKPVNNTAQSGLADPADRQSNVRGVYRAVDPERIAGMRVLLIDDVITTGSTLEEASRTLLDAGAASVVAATVASAI